MAKVPSRGPLNWEIPIVNPRTGTPTPEFHRKWQEQARGLPTLLGDPSKYLDSTGTWSIPASSDIQAGLDTISTTRGAIIYRGSAGWVALAPGVLGQLLQTGGVGADPSWANAPSADIQALLDTISTTRGAVLYRGNSQWVALAPGTAGDFLRTAGAGADPTWAAPNVQDLLDDISSVRGTVLYRGAGGWAGLPPGTADEVLTTGGAGADPSWQPPDDIQDLLDTISTAQGVILYRSASAWVALAPGQPGYVLTTDGPGANPYWGTIMDIQALLNTISITHGAMVYRNATAWVAIIPGLSGQVLTTGGPGTDPTWETPALPDVQALLDSISSTRGVLLYRDGTEWVALTPGAVGQVLQTGGAGADPAWVDIQGIQDMLDSISTTRGTVLFRGASAWSALAPGANGSFLRTSGAGADPSWAANDVQTLLNGISTTQGTVLYRNATTWVALGPGTAGQMLRTAGAAANPAWDVNGITQANDTNNTTLATTAFVRTDAELGLFSPTNANFVKPNIRYELRRSRQRADKSNAVLRRYVDATAWKSSTNPVNNDWYGVCWAPELGLFCAISDTGTGDRVMTSPDGVTWTARTSAADNNWYAICWSPELRLFCVVGYSGTGNRVMTSPDGINWTLRTSAADNAWRSVCWSPELGLFCAVSGSGVGNRVMTSPDGINWTSRTSAADNGWFGICWSPELRLFCAVSNNGTGNRVMTSPDGINWTIRTSAADNAWYAVCWSSALGLFCVSGYTGTGDRIMTSPDGITWTTRASAADNQWYTVCWSPELGQFCSVSGSGTGNRVMTSPDGITWTLRTSAAGNSWRNVCWAPELGLFCSVSANGTGNRVMTSVSSFTYTYRS